MKVAIENGELVIRPVIWHNNEITKLKGLEGDLGIESEESYGFDMNNKGEVVGKSLTSLVYKNNVYYQVHAVKWVNGQAIDINNTIPKGQTSEAVAINAVGDVLINSQTDKVLYLVRSAKKPVSIPNISNPKINSSGYIFNDAYVFSPSGIRTLADIDITKKIKEDSGSIWMKALKIMDMNDNGEIIAEGETIYGERHAMLLTPSNSSN